MKKFILTQEQAQILLNILGEFPAKSVINGVDILRNLQPIANENEEEVK